MLSHSAYNRIYRLSAWYDLAVSLPFATAITLGHWWPFLDWLSRSLGFEPLGPLDVHAMLFANFFGSVVTVWSVLRLRFNRNALGRYDAAGRALFSLAMAHALMNGGPTLIWPMLVAEVTFFVLQVLPAEMEPHPAAAIAA